jgi:hypothetical protein
MNKEVKNDISDDVDSIVDDRVLVGDFRGFFRPILHLIKEEIEL